MLMLIDIISLADPFDLKPTETLDYSLNKYTATIMQPTESLNYTLDDKSKYADANYTDEDRYVSISYRFCMPLNLGVIDSHPC